MASLFCFSRMPRHYLSSLLLAAKIGKAIQKTLGNSEKSDAEGECLKVVSEFYRFRVLSKPIKNMQKQQDGPPAIAEEPSSLSLWSDLTPCLTLRYQEFFP